MQSPSRNFACISNRRRGVPWTHLHLNLSKPTIVWRRIFIHTAHVTLEPFVRAKVLLVIWRVDLISVVFATNLSRRVRWHRMPPNFIDADAFESLITQSTCYILSTEERPPTNATEIVPGVQPCQSKMYFRADVLQMCYQRAGLCL